MTQDCLHCGGTGEEPFSDGETCGICLGERAVPEQVNRDYYETVSAALSDSERKEDT